MHPVTLVQAKERLVAYRRTNGAGPHPAASLADVIWPDAQFLSRQGAGAAATRVLKRLGCYWVCRNVKGDRIAGWIISFASPYAFAASMVHCEAIINERLITMPNTIRFKLRTERKM